VFGVTKFVVTFFVLGNSAAQNPKFGTDILGDFAKFAESVY